VPAQRLLLVLSFALGRGGANRMDAYGWSDDCTRPAALGGLRLSAAARRTSFYLWQAPGGARTLLFVSMFSGGSNDLQVLDVSNPAAPRLAGTWSAAGRPAPLGLAERRRDPRVPLAVDRGAARRGRVPVHRRAAETRSSPC